MGDLAECKACGNGVMLPFSSPPGFTAYFCNNCRRRFMAYAFEPAIEGKEIFSGYAVYMDEPFTSEILPLAGNDLMDKYKALLDANPPEDRAWDDQAPSLPEVLDGFA